MSRSFFITYYFFMTYVLKRQGQHYQQLVGSGIVCLLSVLCSSSHNRVGVENINETQRNETNSTTTATNRTETTTTISRWRTSTRPSPALPPLSPSRRRSQDRLHWWQFPHSPSHSCWALRCCCTRDHQFAVVVALLLVVVVRPVVVSSPPLP